MSRYSTLFRIWNWRCWRWRLSRCAAAGSGWCGGGTLSSGGGDPGWQGWDREGSESRSCCSLKILRKPWKTHSSQFQKRRSPSCQNSTRRSWTTWRTTRSSGSKPSWRFSSGTKWRCDWLQIGRESANHSENNTKVRLWLKGSACSNPPKNTEITDTRF